MPPTDRVLTRLGRGMAKALTEAPHPEYRDTWGISAAPGQTPWTQGRIPDDYWTNRERIGDGSFTGIVENVLAVKTRAFTEIVPQVGIDGDDPEAPPEPDTTHPANLLLRQPNEAMSWRLLGDYLVGALDTAGTGYLVKVGAQEDGPPFALWPLYPHLMVPVSRRGDFISYWEYTVDGVTTRIAPEDVIVLRNRLNRADHRLGQSSLEPVLREVATDEEAARFASTILHNLGVPGVVLTARDQYNPPGQEEAARTLSTWRDRFGGNRRGEPWIQSDYDISVVSFSPQQMDLRTLRQIPEERISGALGVPAIIAQLGAGLEAATYSNAAELRAFFTEQTLIPLWNQVAEDLTAGILGADVLAGRRIFFDTTKVRALQEDRNEEAERIVRLVTGKVLTVDEGRELLGYGPLPENIVDVDEGVGTAFVEGEPEDIELTNDTTNEIGGESRAWLPPLVKAASEFDDSEWEDRYDDRIGDVFAGWAADFAREAELVGDAPDALAQLADRVIDSEALREALNQLGVALVADSAEGDDAVPTKAASLNPRDVEAGMARFLDQHATRRAESMSQWTRTRVRNTIARGVDAGKSATEIAADVTRWLGSKERSQVVAVTEVTAARNSAANYAAQQDPRPMWKSWRTVGDSHVRDSHMAANNQQVLDFQTFNVGGWAMSHPGDPSGPAEETINCRCRLEFRLASSKPGGTSPRGGFSLEGL